MKKLLYICKLIGPLFLIVISFKVFAADCGIKPKSMEFGPNCELLRTKLAPTKKAPPPLPPPPQKGPMPTDAGNQNRWEPLQLGAYSGKPGYYVRIGTEFQSKLDALIMNEEVLAKVEKATAELKLGGLTTCQGMGLQQAIGYTLFDLRHCEN